MNAITFSIVICNYNYGKFIGEAIESCLAQDYPAELFDIIVVDDGSTDDSRAVIEQFTARGRVSAICQPNQGQAAAFAAGVARATGDFVCLLDSDDLYLPSKLVRVAERIAALAPAPEHFFLCHDYLMRDDIAGKLLEQTGLQGKGLRAYGELIHFTRTESPYPFANPCGQVYSRAVLQRVCQAIPLADWKQGADNPIAHAALLVAETVHYLHEPLAVYRLHGANFFGSVEDGHYKLSAQWRTRWPKLLRFLESFIDTLELDTAQRNQRLAYLKLREREVRATSLAHRLAEPRISFIVFDDGDDSRLGATLFAVAAQTHPMLDLVVVTGRNEGIPATANPMLQQAPRTALVPSGTGAWEHYRAGYRAARGDYLVFLDAGHMPDAVFAERHLFVHRYVALSMVTSSDVRIINEANAMLYSGVYNASGAWPQPLQYIPPHAAALRDWIFPPLPANVIRNSRFLDLLFDCDGANLPDCGGHSAWLLLHYAHALGGSTRINECLLSYRVPDAAAATYAHLMEPPGNGCAAAAPDYEAGAELIFDIFCRAHALFNAYYPGAWQAQFIAWLKNRNSPGLPERLKRVAERAGAPAAGALLG